MKRLLIIALLALCAGCSSIAAEKPAWQNTAEFMTDAPHTFFGTQEGQSK